MAKKWRQDPDVIAEIERLAIQEFSSTSIERELHASTKFKRRALPSLRTIQAIAREAAPRDPAEWWSAATAPVDEARVILPILGELLERTGGRYRRVRRRHAHWVAKVLAWAPDIPPATAFALGWAYARAQQADEATDSLDRYISLGLWRDPDQQVRAFREGWVDVIVWDPPVAKIAGVGSLELLAERPGATLLWPFMASHPMALLRDARSTGERRFEASVIDFENDEEEASDDPPDQG